MQIYASCCHLSLCISTERCVSWVYSATGAWFLEILVPHSVITPLAPRLSNLRLEVLMYLWAEGKRVWLGVGLLKGAGVWS